MSSSSFVRHDDPLGPDAGDRLCPEDAQALDIVFGGPSFGPAGLDTRAARPARVAALLALLDGISFSDSDRETLVQATMAKVSLSRHTRVLEAEPVLVPDDEDALEALVSAEFQLARVPSGMRERAARHLSLLGLLEPRPGALDSADALVASTLARVQSVIDSQQDRLSLSRRASQRAERWGGGRFFAFVRSRELISVAALILIATAMLTPLAQYLREYSRRTSCQQNMATAGWAFSQYAASNRDRLPVASSCQPGNLFWNVGKERDQSNSANVFLLRAQNYASIEDLSCAGQATRTCRSLGADAWDWPELKQVSYSYQNMFAKERPSWSNTARIVVLADASPVIRRAVRHEVIYPFENSANHMGRGQNVLWNDASSQWLTTPVLPTSDNIWLPRDIESKIAKMLRPHESDPLGGHEFPSAADDVFLGP